MAGALAGHRSRLLALNSARVAFKHHGNLPSASTLERSRVNVLDFLSEASSAVLDVRFDQVSLTAFIRDSAGRGLVEDAERRWQSGDAEEATIALAKAFDSIVRNYEKRKIGFTQDSLFKTRPTFLRSGNMRDLGLDSLIDWLSAIDERTKLLAFGIDLRGHAYFSVHTPTVRLTMAGAYVVDAKDINGTTVAVTQDVFERCHRFVIDTALTLTAEDYDFDGWALRRAAGGWDE